LSGATTRIYDRRKINPEDSPTFKASYGCSLTLRILLANAQQFRILVGLVAFELIYRLIGCV
jgi:hypothetical protein